MKYLMRRISVGTAIAFLVAVFIFTVQQPIIRRFPLSNPNSLVPAPRPSLRGVQLWNLSWGTGLGDTYRDVDVDQFGNIFAGGWTNDYYAVLTKYAPNGTQLWNQVWGGNGEQGFGIDVDANGNAYITGFKYNFGPGDSDAFLVKYASNGTLQWSRIWGGTGSEEGYDIDVDGNGYIYLTGYTTSFGAGGDDMFLTKYDQDGNQVWYRTWGGVNSDSGLSVAIDGSNNIFVGGATASVGAGGNDAFLIKYDTSGTRLWNLTWGGTGFEQGWKTLVDITGNIYLVGLTDSFGGSGINAFVAKYAQDGAPLLNWTWGGAGSQSCFGAAIDDNNNILITGDTNGPGNSDAFATIFNANGQLIYSTTINLDDPLTTYGIVADHEGNFIFAGSIMSMTTFDTNFFIAKYFYHVPASLTITTPSSGATFSTTPPSFSVTVEEPDLNVSWYGVGVGGMNHTFLPGTLTPVNTAEWLAQPNGPVVLQFWANNSQGDMGYTNLTVQKAVQFTSSGTQSWNRTWGGVDAEAGYAVAVDGSGNTVIGGSTRSLGAGAFDAVVCSHSPDGTLVRNWTWGGENDEHGYGIAFDKNGNIIIAGSTNSFGAGSSDAFVAKFDVSGTLLWNYTWGGTSDDGATEISLDDDNNIYLVGSTQSAGAGGIDAFLVKYSTDGMELWNRTWGGSADDGGCGITIDETGNIYIVGNTWSVGMGQDDAYLVKYTSDGTQVWNRTWGGTNTDNTQGITVDGVGNLYITGFTQSYTVGGSDAFLLKYSPGGTRLWNLTWGGASDDVATGTGVDDYGNVFLAGYTNCFGAGGYDAFLAFYDSNGTSLINWTWGGVSNDFGEMVAAGSGSALLVGYTDSFGLGGNDTFLVKYLIAPYLTVNAPETGALFGTIGPSFNVTIADPDLSTAWYSVGSGNGNHSFTSGIITPVDALDWGTQANGSVTLQFWANDTAGNLGTTSVVVRKDISSPVITINTPTPGKVCNDTAPAFSLSISEGNLNTIWYSLDGGSTNTTCSVTGTFVAQWGSLPNGTVTVAFWANDTAGNIGTASVVILKDITLPIITINTPVAGNIYGTTAPAFSLVIVEGNLNTIWYSLNGGGTNTTCGLSGTLSAQWGSRPNGTVTISFWARDLAGNVNTTSLSVFKDSSAPSITIITPTTRQLCNVTAPQYFLSIVEGNLNTTWFSLDGGATKTICSQSGTLSAQWGSRPNGTVTVTFWANDTVGNTGTASVLVWKAIIAPTITGTGLVSGQVYGASAPPYTLTIAGGGNLNTTWYSLDDGGTNTTCSLTGTLSAQWGSRPNGTVTVKFWVNDTLGNTTSTTISIRKDVVTPAITINLPIAFELCNVTPPAFSLLIVEGNLNLIWYSLDGGATNTTCGISGTFSAQWGSRPNGTVTVTFWANDTVGNKGTASVQLWKDISAPSISINTPVAWQLCNVTPPEFSLTILEANLYAIWYSLDGGTTNTSCGLTGILESLWPSLPNGTITVTFWANDTAGNVGTVSVFVRKGITAPIITDTGLTPWQLCGTTAPAFTLTIVGEGNLDATWYSLDGGATNTTCSISDTLVAQWNTRPNGTITVIFWANDTMGNCSTTNITIHKDIFVPIFINTGIVPFSVFSNIPPDFSLSIIEGNLVGIWYSLDGGKTNTSCSSAGSLVLQWTSIVNGTVMVTFWANDLVGNEGMTTIIVHKDVIEPVIGVLLPSVNAHFTTEPTFTLSILEGNLDSTWYTVGAGTEKHFFTGSSCKIDPAVWSALPKGEVVIKFYANDTAGNYGSYSHTIVKDEGEFPWIWIIIGVAAGIGVTTVIIVLRKRSSPRIIPQPRFTPKKLDVGPKMSEISINELIQLRAAVARRQEKASSIQPLAPKEGSTSAPTVVKKEETQKTCPSCKNVLKIEAKFCNKCGWKF